MKFIKKEIQDDVTYYLIRFNGDEIRILYTLTTHYFRNIPKLIETTSLVGRIRSMRRDLLKIKLTPPSQSNQNYKKHP
jgi:hypothetical protein